MIESYNHRLLLNGKLYNSSQLNDLCESKLNDVTIPDWEKEVYDFIQSWLDKKEFLIVNTSGSTGKPKPIRLLKSYMINSALLSGRSIDIKKNSNTLLCLPTKYIAGKMMIVRSFVLGLNLIPVEPSMSPLRNIEAKIDFVLMVPLQISNTLSDEKSRKKLSNIDKVLIGGGKLNNEINQKLKNFSNHIFETYGMTETCTHIALKNLNGKNSNNHFEVLDRIEVGLDNRGCLTIKAPDLCSNEIITNDMAEIIDGNKIIIQGRIDNIINSGGVKISPEVIESKIGLIIDKPFIVTSIPDADLGEKLILLIEDKQRNIAGLYELWQKLDKELKGIELPKQIEYLASFVYAENNKINRNATNKDLLKLIS